MDEIVGNRSRPGIGSQRESPEMVSANPSLVVNRLEPLAGGVIYRWETAAAGVLVLAAFGCSVIPPVTSGNFGDLAQLRSFIVDLEEGFHNPIGYRGCDDCYHYFCISNGKAYTVPREAWRVTAMPVALGFCIPLVFSDEGRLEMPPSTWSQGVNLASLQWTLSRGE